MISNMFWAGKPTGKHLHSTKVASFSTCQKMWPCRFEWQVWHFVAFHVCEVQDFREAEVYNQFETIRVTIADLHLHTHLCHSWQ